MSNFLPGMALSIIELYLTFKLHGLKHLRKDTEAKKTKSNLT